MPKMGQGSPPWPESNKKGLGLLPGLRSDLICKRLALRIFRQFMLLGHIWFAAISALFQAYRLLRHGAKLITVSEGDSACRADHRVLQVGLDVGVLNRGLFTLFLLERPFLNCAVDLPQVIDTGVHLRSSA